MGIYRSIEPINKNINYLDIDEHRNVITQTENTKSEVSVLRIQPDPETKISE